MIVGSEADPCSACTFGFDLSQGQSLQATVVSQAQGEFCTGSRATIAPFGAWTWTLIDQDAPGGGDAIISGSYAATNGSCSGTVG